MMVFAGTMPAVQREQELEERVIELEAEIARLKLQQKKDMRRVVDDRDDGTYPRVYNRLVELGYLESRHVQALQGEEDATTVKGNKPCLGINIYRATFKARMSAISTAITAAYKKKNNGYLPPQRKSDRTNAYTLQDYHDFADQILHDYMKKNPIESWRINWKEL